MAQPTVTIQIGGTEGVAAGGSLGTAMLGLALIAGALYILHAAPVAVQADAAFWYEVGRAVPSARASAVAHLKALAQQASGAVAQQIAGYLKDLGASS